MSKRCSAKNRNGERCGAWAVIEGDKCALHLNPELAAKMGAKHGRGAAHPHPLADTQGYWSQMAARAALLLQTPVPLPRLVTAAHWPSKVVRSSALNSIV
jgi:hypothetical protein